MKKNITIFYIVALILLMIVVFQSAYVVKETEQVVITQFGKPVGDAITEPGLKFKTPFIQKTNYFEKNTTPIPDAVCIALTICTKRNQRKNDVSTRP